MKYVVSFAMFLLLVISGASQSTNKSAVAALIISTNGQQSLTVDETAQLSFIMWRARMLTDDAQLQQTLIASVEQTIATNHGIGSDQPFQIVLDTNWTLSYAPVWNTVAVEGDSVTIKAGTTVRYGNVAGTACGYAGACGTTPLPNDTWKTITFSQDTTLVVGNDVFGDAAYGYAKVLQVLGNGVVIKAPTA